MFYRPIILIRVGHIGGWETVLFTIFPEYVDL